MHFGRFYRCYSSPRFSSQMAMMDRLVKVPWRGKNGASFDASGLPQTLSRFRNSFLPDPWAIESLEDVCLDIEDFFFWQLFLAEPRRKDVDYDPSIHLHYYPQLKISYHPQNDPFNGVSFGERHRLFAQEDLLRHSSYEEFFFFSRLTSFHSGPWSEIPLPRSFGGFSCP